MNSGWVDARKHYDTLIREDNDPFFDPPEAQHYMQRWDGPRFWGAIGDLEGRHVLEVGIGTGRLARMALVRGCAHLTGIDLSPLTIERARTNLSAFSNTELLVADITRFRRPGAYDLAYSVLTWMHIEDKRAALENTVAALRHGGRLVLSVAQPETVLEYGRTRLRLFPTGVDATRTDLQALRCSVEPPVELRDPDGSLVATLLIATKSHTPSDS
jgi:SAM-dependent methyltransferase